jgi:hypothetical protein
MQTPREITQKSKSRRKISARGRVRVPKFVDTYFASFGNSTFSAVTKVLIRLAPEGSVDVRARRVPSMVRVRGTRHFKTIPVVPCVVYSYLGNCIANTCYRILVDSGRGASILVFSFIYCSLFRIRFRSFTI